MSVIAKTSTLVAVASLGVLAFRAGAGAVPVRWDVSGSATVRACVDGLCGRNRERFTSVLILDVDEAVCRRTPRRSACGTYQVVRGGRGCRPGTITPDEVGVVVLQFRATRTRLRLRLEPTNLDELTEALRLCVPAGSLEMRSYSHRLDIRSRGQGRQARGVASLRLRIGLRGRTLDVHSSAGYRGIL